MRISPKYNSLPEQNRAEANGTSDLPPPLPPICRRPRRSAAAAAADLLPPPRYLYLSLYPCFPFALGFVYNWVFLQELKQEMQMQIEQLWNWVIVHSLYI